MKRPRSILSESPPNGKSRRHLILSLPGGDAFFYRDCHAYKLEPGVEFSMERPLWAPLICECVVPDSHESRNHQPPGH